MAGEVIRTGKAPPHIDSVEYFSAGTNQGWSQRQTCTEAQAASLKIALDAARFPYQISRQPDSPNWVVEYRTPEGVAAGDLVADPNKALEDLWELEGNRAEVSLWKHPLVANELAKLYQFEDDARIATTFGIRKLIESMVQGDDEFQAPDGKPFGLPTGSVDALEYLTFGTGIDVDMMVDFLDARLRGSEAFPVTQWTLRRTVIAPYVTNLTPAIAFSNYIFTTARLRASENLPVSLRFAVPDQYWLKETPTMQLQANGTWQISYTYTGADQVDPFVYFGKILT